MRYNETIKVRAVVFDEMEHIVQVADPDVEKDGAEFDREVTFLNGNRMSIQVCGPGNPGEEPCWTQGVLFDSNGNELGCTDVGESFGGEYHIDVDNDEYVVDVERVEDY